MRILKFDELESTQKFLIERLKSSEISEETCVLAREQKNGIGSRGNKWSGVERGLYCSFCARNLSGDIKPQSFAIFFGFVIKEILRDFGSKTWLKYPNDLYLIDQKIGGILTNIVGDFVVCGVGINLSATNFAHLDIDLNIDTFLARIFKDIKLYSWAQIFESYSKEFHLNKYFSFHANGEVLSFEKAVLLSDGAVEIDGKKLYSAR